MTDVHELGALYDRFGRAAYRLALAMLENKQSAEDAVAEGFADFWRTVSSAAAPDDAYRLLLTLVHRAAVRRARREGTTTASNCASATGRAAAGAARGATARHRPGVLRRLARA